MALKPSALTDAGGTDAGAPADAPPADGVSTPDGADASEQRCTTSRSCPRGFECLDGSCRFKSRGTACVESRECASGFCVDGVCCNAACEGGCVACNTPDRPGFCWPIDSGQPDPHRVCADEGPATCGATGACDGFGGCLKYPAGTTCAPSRCVDNAFQAARFCDGNGRCGPTPEPRACAPYACNPANCLNACTSDLGCQAPAVCLGGSCRPLPALSFSDPRGSSEIGAAYPEPLTDDACPPGSAVIGYDITTTADPSFVVLTSVRSICGELRLSHAGGRLAVEVGAATALTQRGHGAGPSVQLRCPANQAVIGYDGRSGAFIDQFSLRCAPLVISNTETTVAVGAALEVGPVGGNGGAPHGVTDCGPAAVATGTRSLADVVVKRLALLCSNISLRNETVH